MIPDWTDFQCTYSELHLTWCIKVTTVWLYLLQTGETALHLAVCFGRYYAAQLLLGAGASVNSKSKVLLYGSLQLCSILELLLLIGVGLSVPHTSVTSLHSYMCMFACLDWPLSVSHFRLSYFHILRRALIQRGLQEDQCIMNNLPPQWQQLGWRPLMDLPI